MSFFSLSLFIFSREINKALCGFLIQRKSWQKQSIFIDKEDSEMQLVSDDKDSDLMDTETSTVGIFATNL